MNIDKENNKVKNDYKPDMTNYDFVWGSDQDEYVKDKQSAAETTEQKDDSAEQ